MLKPSFVACDVYLGTATAAGVRPFINKCNTLRSLRNVGSCMQMFVASKYNADAFQLLKNAYKDTDARWTKKGGVAFYGYKNHVNVDHKHKLIRKYKVTDASVHDSQELDSVLDPKNDSQDTWADSAYRSEEQEARLKEQGQTSHIHERAYRNKPLTPEQEAANKARSSVRARIEHVFGHIETAMHGCYVRTIGIARARVKIGLEVLAYNMSRFTFLMRSRGTIASA